MKTLHLILNAHLDPIWLWPWQAGLDEALATCRSACDRLDANPDVIFTRGEAWVYEQIERVDPELFGRIQAHVAGGRWEIVGGWYIQPDCNFPSAWGMQQQIGLGKAYFQEKFGKFPRTAYNVDSFGHAAALPELMRAAGQDSYIMMRPHQRDKPLPARLFRWRGYEGGPEVVTYRITTYITNSDEELSLDYLHRVVEDLPEGIEHALCFIGIGDHGGGPSERQIAWCREHQDAMEGWRLQFSSPSRFFDAVAPQAGQLPLVTGDLQPHAVGCYTVVRAVKTGVRRAEHLLKQAEMIAGDALRPDDAAALIRAWKHVCFHQFHDTLGGTSIPSAYVQVVDNLGSAATVGDEILQYTLRRRMNALPPDPQQRIVLFNASDSRYDGYVEFEPWVDWWKPWTADCRLIDEQGEPVPFQVIESEAHAHFFGPGGHFSRLLFPIALEPSQMRALRIERNAEPRELPAQTAAKQYDTLSNNAGVTRTSEAVSWDTVPFSLTPRLESIRDYGDTWGQSANFFGEEPADVARWGDPIVLDSNPLMAALAVEGRIGESKLRAEWRVYADSPFAELKLRVHWQEQQRVLKLVIPFGAGPHRTDGVMGTSLERENNGVESPLRDWVRLGSGDRSLGIVCPDVYGLDATPERVRLTLLRGVLMAYHTPYSHPIHRGVFSDQGVHEFRFRFFAGSAVSEAVLEQQALMMHRPPVMADLTRGMPPEFRGIMKRV